MYSPVSSPPRHSHAHAVSTVPHSSSQNPVDMTDKWITLSNKLEDANKPHKDNKDIADRFVVNETIQSLRGLIKELTQTEWIYKND